MSTVTFTDEQGSFTIETPDGPAKVRLSSNAFSGATVVQTIPHPRDKDDFEVEYSISFAPEGDRYSDNGPSAWRSQYKVGPNHRSGGRVPFRPSGWGSPSYRFSCGKVDAKKMERKSNDAWWREAVCDFIERSMPLIVDYLNSDPTPVVRAYQYAFDREVTKATNNVRFHEERLAEAHEKCRWLDEQSERLQSVIDSLDTLTTMDEKLTAIIGVGFSDGAFRRSLPKQPD